MPHLLYIPPSLAATHDIIHSHYDTNHNYWLRIMIWPTPRTRASGLIGQKAVWLVSVCPWIVWLDWLQSFTPVRVDICMWGKGWNVHCPNSFPFLVAMTPANRQVGDLWKSGIYRFRHFEIYPDILSYSYGTASHHSCLINIKRLHNKIIVPCLLTTSLTIWQLLFFDIYEQLCMKNGCSRHIFLLL